MLRPPEAYSNNTDFEEFGNNESTDTEYDRLDRLHNFLRFKPKMIILKKK